MLNLKAAFRLASSVLLFGTLVDAQGQFPRANSPGVGVYEVVINNGRVIDPESGLDAIRNIGVSGGIIQAVSSRRLYGRIQVDATGLIVAPGFIDLDAYPQNVRYSVRDGVTTALDLRGGTAEVAKWYGERDNRMLINFGVAVSYPKVREAVMGDAGRIRHDKVNPASEAQLAEILRRISTAFDEGALALGMGPSELLGPPTWELLENWESSWHQSALRQKLLRR